MSWRTIVEFNHDFAYRIADQPDRFLHALENALRSSDKASWDALKPYGMRRATTCHHSDERKAVVRGHDFPLG